MSTSNVRSEVADWIYATDLTLYLGCRASCMVEEQVLGLGRSGDFKAMNYWSAIFEKVDILLHSEKFGLRH